MPEFQEIEVNGEILEFPADMSDQDIAVAIRKANDPLSAPTRAQMPGALPINPAEGLSGMDKLRAGFGKAFSDINMGLMQRSAELANVLPPSIQTMGARAQVEPLREEVAERRRLDAPLMDTKAGFGGNIAGHIAAFAPAGGAVTSFPRALGLGAAEGFVQPSASSEETFLNTAVGGGAGLGGHGLARGAQRLFSPVNNTLSPRGQDAVDLLRREGVDLDVSQRTGSAAAGRLRSSFGDNPLTLGRQQEFTDNQRRQFTRAVLRRMGVDSDEATPEVLREATQRIGRQIDEAVDSSPAMFDTNFAADLQNVQRSIAGQLTEADARPLLNNIDELFRGIDPASNQINPAIFRRVRSNLSALRAKPGVGQVAGDLEASMMDALERSGGNREGLRTALAQWRNWRIIENSIDKGTDKTISPLRLSTTMNQKRNRAVSLRGLGHRDTVDLARLAEAGRSVLPESLGNSGTFGRAMIGEGLLFAGGAGGATLAGKDVKDAATIGLGAAALPMILQRGMLSQGATGNFLSEGINPLGLGALMGNPVTEALIRQSAISGGLLSQ